LDSKNVKSSIKTLKLNKIKYKNWLPLDPSMIPTAITNLTEKREYPQGLITKVTTLSANLTLSHIYKSKMSIKRWRVWSQEGSKETKKDNLNKEVKKLEGSKLRFITRPSKITL
jgi:hypothetical protein